MKLVLVAVVALLIGYGYANLSTPKPVVVATATQVRTPLPVVTQTVLDVHAIDFQTEHRPLILAIACRNTPSQCSLQNGVPDWTAPAYGCDWNYSTTKAGCVPDQPGDYDCPDLHAMGLWEIRVLGDDWMLLDEDEDGLGCEIDREAVDAEAARCDSLYEPERTTCFDVLKEYNDVLEYEEYEPDYPDDDHQSDRDQGDYDEPDPLENYHGDLRD
jgi:hypothetical protein